jgi:hypothetical protein
MSEYLPIDKLAPQPRRSRRRRRWGRDLPGIPGREPGGVHFAMDFLPQQNQVA